MVDLPEQIQQQVFSVGYERFSKALVDVCREFEDYEELDVLRIIIDTSLMFAINGVVKAGHTEESIQNAVSKMIAAVHFKDKIMRVMH